VVQGFQVGSQRGSRDVLHDQVGALFNNIIAKHLHDIGMAEFLHHLGFTLETGELVRVFVEHTAHDLDSNLPDRAVCAAIDLSHASTRDESMDVDAAECLPCPVCHTKNYNRE